MLQFFTLFFLCGLIMTGLVETASFTLESPDFQNGRALPDRFARQHGNQQPTLRFTHVPEGTRSLALIVEDPDAPAGVWTHWLLANIPPEAKRLGNGLPRGVIIGKNSWGATQYDGPQPPSGMHHYIFRALALDRQLDLKPGFSRRDLERASADHVLATAQLVGTYTAASSKSR